jgi:hypothetical protein
MQRLFKFNQIFDGVSKVVRWFKAKSQFRARASSESLISYYNVEWRVDVVDSGKCLGVEYCNNCFNSSSISEIIVSAVLTLTEYVFSSVTTNPRLEYFCNSFYYQKLSYKKSNYKLKTKHHSYNLYLLVI